MDSIDYKSLFAELGLNWTQYCGNFVCPFCEEKAFKEYSDGKVFCHSCNWKGDAIQLYSEIKKIDKEIAFEELADLYRFKRLKPKKKTREEACKSLADDLYFLAWCRMYFAFYKSSRCNAKYYQDKSELSKSQFSKVLNGQCHLVSRKSWNIVVFLLRKSINIKEFKADIKAGKSFWHESLNASQMNEAIIKHQ